MLATLIQVLELPKLGRLKKLKIRFKCSNYKFFPFHKLSPLKCLEKLHFTDHLFGHREQYIHESHEINLIIKNLPIIAPNLIKLNFYGWIWPRILGQSLCRLKRIQKLILFAFSHKEQKFFVPKVKKICKQKAIHLVLIIVNENQSLSKMFPHSFLESEEEK